jgi:hypothetical protein
MNAPFVGAVALLAINDHVLKGAGWLPPVVTGKLSDFAGLFFFPLLLVALARLARARHGGIAPLCTRDLALAVGATAIVFAAVKTTAGGAALYREALAWVWGAPVRFVADATDLVALLVLPVTWVHGRRLATPARGPSGAAEHGLVAGRLDLPLAGSLAEAERDAPRIAGAVAPQQHA